MGRMGSLSLERFERIAGLGLKRVDFDDLDQLRTRLLEMAGLLVNAVGISNVTAGVRFVSCQAWNEVERWTLKWERRGNLLGEYWAYKVVGCS